MEELGATASGTHRELEQVESSKRLFIKTCAAIAGCLLVPEAAAKSRRHARHLKGRSELKFSHRRSGSLNAGQRAELYEHPRINDIYLPGRGPEFGRFARPKGERVLAIYNTHTGESFNGPYWANGIYQPNALREFSILLRDHHNNEIHPIDPQLLDLLHRVQRLMGHSGSYHILSGYRSPETNELLGRHNPGVAEHSMHLEGKAVDLRLPGRSLSYLRRAAVALRGGGVGYYPESNFIHIDSGSVRYWES